MLSSVALFVYVVTGLFAGFLGGLLGIGGGLVVVPVLTLMFHLLKFPPEIIMQMAIGTSLSGMVFTSAASAYGHINQKGVKWPLVTALAPGTMTGAVVGSLVAHYLPSYQLRLIFACSVTIIGLYYLLAPRLEEESADVPTISPLLLGLSGIGIGAISSILGIGGGLITVPVLNYFKVPIKAAISSSAVTGFLIACTGAISFLSLGLRQADTVAGSFGYLYLPAFLCISVTSVLAAPFGAKVAYALPTVALRKIFGCLLVGVGLLMGLS